MSESNRDEAARCLNIAERHRDNGNTEAARKFGRKSISLYETKEALAFLETLDTYSASSSASSSSPSSPVSDSTARDDGTSTPTGSRDDKERVAVVRRIRACKATEYYKILGLQQSCSDGEIKKAYRKLAILTHPDKSDVPGAAEAFKMVARAWQVLGDTTLREQYDAAPTVDPTSRFSSQRAPTAQGFGPGAEMSPEELFNMFFNGGFQGGGFQGGPGVFSASFGPGGFQTFGQPRRAPRQQAGGQQQQNGAGTSPIIQLLPIIILFAISFLGSLPGLASLFTTPDPGFSFTPSRSYSSERLTSTYHVPYYVNTQEFTSHPIFESIPESSRNVPQAGSTSSKLRTFENGIERAYVSSLRSTCNREFESKEQRMDRHRGIFGFLGDPEMVEKIRQEPMPSCQKLRDMGLLGS